MTDNIKIDLLIEQITKLTELINQNIKTNENEFKIIKNKINFLIIKHYKKKCHKEKEYQYNIQSFDRVSDDKIKERIAKINKKYNDLIANL